MNVKSIIQSKIPTLIWGMPGVGKTAAVQAAARLLGLPCEVVIASLREPSDFAGLPVIVDGEVRLAAPAWARRLSERPGVLFLDEITTAPPAVQAALLRVVLDRAVGDTMLHPDTAIIAAANPPEIAAGGWELTLPLANRFAHEEWVLDPIEWADNFPDYWGENRPGWEYRAKVAAFIHARPNLLLAVPKEGESVRAYPTPRSWDMATQRIAVGLSIAACVGEAAALEYAAWERDADLPDPAVLLAGESLDLPKRGDIAFAMLSSLAVYANSIGDEITWRKAWKLIASVEEIDLAATAARILTRGKKSDWAIPAEVKIFVPLLREAGAL